MIVKKTKIPLLLSLIALAGCSKGAPSKSEIQSLLIKEGLPYAEQQVRYEPWLYLYRVSLSRPGGWDKSYVFKDAEKQLDSVKVNDSLLKKYLKNDLSVESVKCEESDSFKNFYNCFISIRYNTETHYYLKTYDIMLQRTDDGELSVSNTDEFSLQSIGYGKFGHSAYHDLPQNLFTSLKSLRYAPATDAQSIYIPNSEEVVEDKQFYKDLVNRFNQSAPR